MSYNTPLVSITLSTYNIEQYIAGSLDCLINQTYKNTEIICIDDGSTDNTLKILKEYATKDKRIKVVAKPKNEGLAVARNLSLKLAKGKYIIFLDGDDLFDLTMVEKAVKKAEAEKADMVIWDYVVFYNEKEIESLKKQESVLLNIHPNDKKSLLKLPAFTWVKLLNLKKLRDLNIHFPDGLTRQDIPVHWQLITSIESIALLPKKLSYYRQQKDATTAKTDSRLFDLAYVMDITKKYLDKNNLYPSYKEVFLEQQLNLLAGMYDKVSKEYKNQVTKIIKLRLLEDQKKYINSNKTLRWQARLFYKSLSGNKVAEFKLSLWYLIRFFYRKTKVFNVY